jgi:hypothetical protein
MDKPDCVYPAFGRQIETSAFIVNADYGPKCMPKKSEDRLLARAARKRGQVFAPLVKAASCR